MNYSAEDKLVLDYFFTNHDKPVFVAKNFHPEVWALMQARYSRAKDDLRPSFLALLKEDPENFQRLLKEIELTKGGIESKYATEKAIQFMEKWVLGYGHSSVAEGAVIGIGLEGVSILATKVIEDNRLASYIEKSTRYVSFSDSAFYIDKKLLDSKFAAEVQDLIKTLYKTYVDLHEPVLEYVKSVAPLEKEMTKVAWERACAARRFDAIRYLLPAGTRTSLAWTLNARQLSHAISKLLSHPLHEMNDIGEMVRQEASKVLPSLLRFAEPKQYLIKTQQDMFDNAKFLPVPDSSIVPVSLVRGPQDADDTVIAAILYKYQNASYNAVLSKVKQLSFSQKEQILDNYLRHMGPFDVPLRELEHVQFTFDITMDYGAFRDLQRQRICTQTNPILTADLGYDIPKDIVAAGVADKYKLAMDKARIVYDKIAKEFPLEAQYTVPLGFRKRFLLTMNLREVYHFVKLRTIPLAHDSYRKIAYQLYQLMQDNHPFLSKYIVCNYAQSELGRLKTEEATEKLDRIGPL